MRPRLSFRFRLLPALLAAGLAASLALPPAFAESYTRGDYFCDDFQEAKKDYQSDPTGGYAVAYALCLLARNKGDDVTALNILDSEIKKGRVDAARDKAVYIATGGTMEQKKLDDRKYNKALQAYKQVLHLINIKKNYPKGFEGTEETEQHELEAYFYVTWISYKKYLAGLDGSDNNYLLQSPTYKEREAKKKAKEKKPLKLYPEYSPFTMDTLKKTRDHAKTCVNLPKKHYYNPDRHYKTILWCRLMVKITKQLLPLEEERLDLLENPSCAKDIEQCSEYKEVLFQKIFPLIEERNREDHKIW